MMNAKGIPTTLWLGAKGGDGVVDVSTVTTVTIMLCLFGIISNLLMYKQAYRLGRRDALRSIRIRRTLARTPSLHLSRKVSSL